MARITGTSSKNNYGFFVDVWDTDVKDGATNTSKVGFKLYIQNNNHRFSGSNYVINMTINGTNYGTTKSIDTTTVGQTEASLILSGTSNAITHNSDGTKSVSISASVSRSSYSSYDGGYMSLSGTFTLQKIDRYFSQNPTLTYVSATETTMNFNWSTSETCSKAILYRNDTAISTQSSLDTTSGSFAVTGLSANTQYSFYVKCTRKDSGMDSNSTSQNKTTYAYPSIKSIGTSAITLPAPGTNISQSIVLNNPLNRTNITVYAKKDSTSGTQFGSVANSSSALTNLTLTLNTNTMYSSIPSATNGKVVYYCVYNDGSAHTSATVAGTFVTSATNCGPTVSANPTYANTNSTHSALVGSDTIIQSKSSFSVTSPAVTARGSATISKYYFKIGSGNYESATTSSKTYSSTSLSGNVIAYCYAEDSRGYTSTVKQVTMRVLPYVTPNATISAARTGYSTDGTIIVSATRSTLFKSSATSTDVNNWRGNTSSNRVSLAISPTDATLAAATIGGAGSFTNQSVSISKLNLEKSYTITVNISDRISTVTKTIVIEKASPILSMNAVSSAVGINTMVGDDASSKLVVNGNTTITNGILTADGSVSISPNAANTTTQIYNNTYLRDNSNLEVSGQIKTTKTTDSSSTSTGALVSAGGLGVAKKLYVGSDANISGNTSISGSATATKGFVSYDTGNVNTASGAGKLVIKKANVTADSTPNNGIVLEFGNYTTWTGQLWLGDNSTAGLAWNGWSNGTRGTWRALAFQDNVDQYSTSETKVGTWIDGKPVYRRVVTGTKVSGTNLQISASWVGDIDTLIRFDGTLRSLSNYNYPLQRYENSSMYTLLTMNRVEKYISVTSSTGNYSNGKVVIIIEYTKTT